MRDARDVYGEEARYARACANSAPHITIHGEGTRFYHSDGTEAFLKRGWYQVSRNGGIVLHWTRKADVLAEIGALTVEEALY